MRTKQTDKGRDGLLQADHLRLMVLQPAGVQRGPIGRSNLARWSAKPTADNSVIGPGRGGGLAGDDGRVQRKGWRLGRRGKKRHDQALFAGLVW